jgi:hypothetical protein
MGPGAGSEAAVAGTTIVATTKAAALDAMARGLLDILFNTENGKHERNAS